MSGARRHGCGAREASCERVCCTRIENFGVIRNGTPIIHDVNLHIHCGELTAIIGANGAGKSTLLKAVLGEIRHSGAMSYHDAKGIRTNRPQIGYVPQYLDFDTNAPVSVLDLFAAVLDSAPCWLRHAKDLRARVENDLGMVRAAHLIDRRLGVLSGGELQRVLLALALDPLPDLLLLDEPVAGVDQSGLELFYEIVAGLRDNHDMSIILVSHELRLLAKYADRVVLLDKTVLADGTPQQIFANRQLQEKYSGAASSLLAGTER